MKILITGTTGFIGAHLLRHFSKSGHELIAWSRPTLPPNGLENFGTYQSVDLLKEVPHIQVDLCIHCAGYASDVGDWDTFYQNNVQTTINLFQAVDAKRSINISSASVYPLLSKSINEEDVDENNFPSLYGKSKYEAENWIKENRTPEQTVFNLRPRGVYGTNDRVLLPRILNQGKKGTIRLPGGGMVKLSMTHISNFIKAVDLCIESKLKGFHTFNVADEESYHIADVFQKVMEGYLNKKVKVVSVPIVLVKNIIRISSLFGRPFPLSMQAFDYITTPSIIDIRKIKKELGYSPQSNFYNEVDELTKWARSIPREMLLSAHKELAWRNYISD